MTTLINLIYLVIGAAAIARSDDYLAPNISHLCNTMDVCSLSPPVSNVYNSLEPNTSVSSICLIFEICAATNGSVDISKFKDAIRLIGREPDSLETCQLLTSCAAASVAENQDTNPFCLYVGQRCEYARKQYTQGSCCINNDLNVDGVGEGNESMACFWSAKCKFTNAVNAAEGTTAVSVDRLDIVHDIYRDISGMCPYAPICQVNASRSIQSAANVLSCCSSCSCSEDCKERKDCCFSNTNMFNEKLTENERLYCTEILSTLGFIRFYMVAQCLNGSMCEPDSINIPVSSLTKQRIYLNERCAHCNSVKDMIHWRYQLHCSKMVSSPDQLGGECEMHLYLPSPVNGLNFEMHFLCNQEMIRSCPEGFRDTRVVELCKRMWAPVLLMVHRRRYYQTYANPYCTLCHGVYLKGVTVCYSSFQNETNIRNPCALGCPMLAILDFSVTRASKYSRNDDGLGPTCVSTLVGCRPVLCPEGTVRVDSQCIPYMKEGRFVRVWTQIRLIPLQNISIKHNSSLERKFCLKNECKWSTSPAKIFASFQKNETRNTVDSIIVQISSMVYLLRTAKYFADVKECLSTTWKIENSKYSASYLVRPILDKYKTFVQDGKSKRAFATKTNNKDDVIEESPLAERYELLAQKCTPDAFHEESDIYVSKLHFCEQVELYPHEIIPLFGEIMLKHNDLVLGDNEFAIDYVETNKHAYTVRVCLEDVNKRNEQSPSSSAVLVKSIGVIPMIALVIQRCVCTI